MRVTVQIPSARYYCRGERGADYFVRFGGVRQPERDL